MSSDLESVPSASSSSSSSSSFIDADGGDRLVLVTGVSGYIASHIVDQLLRLNYRVRGTVRSTKNASLTAHLTSLPHAAGRFELVEADLLNDASWSEAVRGCEFVLHTASPFVIAANVKDVESELIQPAVQGTLSVLKAVANTNGAVKRVVLTSSLVAIMEGHQDDPKYPADHVYTSEDWSDLKGKMDGYPISKTRAELSAWEFVRGLSENQKFEMCTINPGFVLGPLLASKGCTSAEIIIRMLTKPAEPKPKMGFPVVDVRDVALSHIRAMTAPSTDVNGKRFICSQSSAWFKDLASVLANEFPRYHVNSHEVPNFLVNIAGIFDKTARGIKPLLGVYQVSDNTPAVQKLGIQFRPYQKSLVDMVDSLVNLGMVKDKRKPKQ